MAEEQFTSRRARREAERVAADQAFEAREAPEQPNEPSSNDRAELLNPPPAPAQAPESPTRAPEPGPSRNEPEPGGTTSRIDAEPPPLITHERGALATDHAQESRHPVNAEERLDPQRAPLPHFDSRTARKNYLREHGLSLEGDVSTGAIPVIAGPEETSPEESDDAVAVENESFDTAGFGGSADEVAARDFESPVTAASAPRPTSLDDAPHDVPHDALSQPIEDLDAEVASTDSTPGTAEAPIQDDALSSPPKQRAAEPARPAQPLTEPAEPEQPTDESAGPAASAGSAESAETAASAGSDESAESAASAGSDESAEPAPAVIGDDALNDDANDEPGGTSRSRRMPIVQPPSSSGVRVVTAASAQIPEVDSPESTSDAGTDAVSTGRGDSGVGQNAARTSTNDSFAAGSYAGSADSALDVDSAERTDSAEGAGTSSDDAARALAANPETRPMETVPEAWALPNPDYEDEETENPPGTRIRASEVTGHDGRILVGEEPSKVPYVVLGVAALFAVALIVIALVMLL